MYLSDLNNSAEFRYLIFNLGSFVLNDAYKSDRFRKQLSNKHLVAKIGFDTAENEPFDFHDFSSVQGLNFHRAVVSPPNCSAAFLARTGSSHQGSDRRRHVYVLAQVAQAKEALTLDTSDPENWSGVLLNLNTVGGGKTSFLFVRTRTHSDELRSFQSSDGDTEHFDLSIFS